MLLWTITTETYKLFFKSYKELCGVDFSKDFAYADMSTCYDKWLLLTESWPRKPEVLISTTAYDAAMLGLT